MIFRFGAFELDEDLGELRLEGREVPLQPRVFALLAYLVRNRDRVVPKEELLETIWTGTFVADNSLQRAVSVARAALRDGGAEHAIRTYAKRGYRFDATVETAPQQEGTSRPATGTAPAYDFFHRGEWAEAEEMFALCDRTSGVLEPRDLETWATAILYCGRLFDTIPILQRALEAYSGRGDVRGAGRVAAFIGQAYIEASQAALAAAWHSRAARLLDGLEEGEEHGHLAWVGARIALMQGRLEEAASEAERAHGIGRRLGCPTIEALGLGYEGLARVALGQTTRGAKLQDEAAATVLSGGVAPWAGGLIYCGIVWACRNRGDWERAAQWTQTFTEWCQQSGIKSFSGSCRLHRAEILSVQGRVVEAENEIEEASRDLLVQEPWAQGDLHHVLGDLHLALGDLDRAAQSYRRAYEAGWDPQPGYALLLAEQGKVDSALKGLERSLDDTTWYSRQRRGMLLSHYAAIAAQAGHAQRAAEALEELDAAPELGMTPAVGACIAKAQAELYILDGRRRDAVAALRRSVALCRDVGAPLHLIHVRLRLAAVLWEDGDGAGAELELGAAEALANELGLSRLIAKCRSLRSRYRTPA